MSIEIFARNWRHGALILFSANDTNRPCMIRPAAFVYETSSGFAWIEPSYADPYGTPSPALHVRDGELRSVTDEGFVIVTQACEIVTVLPYSDEAQQLDESLNWFAEHLREKALDWLIERERLREFLDDR